MKFAFILTAALLMAHGSYDGIIRGKVKDKLSGEEIIGASVIVKGNKTHGTASGLDGSFSPTVNRTKFTADAPQQFFGAKKQ